MLASPNSSFASFLRALRHKIMAANGWSLRQLYRTLETPGANRLRDAHAALDSAVRSAYGMKDAEDTLAFLPRLNLALAGREAEGEKITPPGLPGLLPSSGDFISVDCIRAPTTTPHPAGGGGDQLQSRSAI